MNKDAVKKIRRVIARWLYYFFAWFFRVFPYGIIRGLIPVILPTGYFLLRRLRRVAMESLTIALGKEKSRAELEQICKDCFYNAGRGLIELGVYMSRPRMIVEKVRFEEGSKELLDAAVNEGKGVMAVSAHYGNFPLMFLYLAQTGYPTNVVIRPSRDEVVEEAFQEVRSSLGVKTVHSIPRDACVQQSIRALRAKELLVVLMDQNTGSKSGTMVDFFGQKAGASTGAIIFAMRTGAPILPMFAMRDVGDAYKIVVLPHFYLEQKATDEETIRHNVQKITTIIEQQVRADLKEWGWMHRRWKSTIKE